MQPMLVQIGTEQTPHYRHSSVSRALYNGSIDLPTMGWLSVHDRTPSVPKMDKEKIEEYYSNTLFEREHLKSLVEL